MKLWNFQTNSYDQVTTITDANATNYMPANKVLENRYALLRDANEQPAQALDQVLQHHTLWA